MEKVTESLTNTEGKSFLLNTGVLHAQQICASSVMDKRRVACSLILISRHYPDSLGSMFWKLEKASLFIL